MADIKILDEHIANQIAAGEVVERPVSVIKELVENAIDAQATRISIDIQQGGLEQIIVTDNGCGISAEDTAMAFERHATSKIINAKSLFRISTLGFRGEALPSIAAISKVTIRTKRAQDPNGSQMTIEGGKKSAVEPVGCPNGTQIAVKDLFYNTPARLKYLKTIATEINHISDYISKMAMAYPKISFQYFHNQRQIFVTRGNTNLEEVLLTIYGSQTKPHWIPIAAENFDFKISGYVAKPQLNRANRQYIIFFINGRYIRNIKLSEAVIKAYHTLLPINKYPMAVLHLEMDYSLLDVNVHPSKIEVRISKENDLFQFLLDNVQKNLHQQNLIPDVRAKGTSEPAAYSQTQSQTQPQQPTFKREQMRIDTKPYDHSYDRQMGQTANVPDRNISEEAVNKTMQAHQPLHYVAPESRQAGQFTSEFPKSIDLLGEVREPSVADNPPVTNETAVHNQDKQVTHRPVIDVRIIGQIHGTYIVAENESGMVLIDQHAAHERINYEKIMRKLKNQQIKKQAMLVPIQLRYTKPQVDLLLEQKQALDEIAVEFDLFGEQTIIVRTHPDWIPDDKLFDFTSYIFDTILHQNTQTRPIDLLEEASIMFACKSSIKANQRLAMEEMERLIADLNQTDTPYTCPHGRPVIIHYSSYELEKLFKRKN